MMTFWLALFSHLIRSLQSEQNGKHQGLVAEPTPWSCGSLAAAVVLALAGFETEPRFAAASESDAAALQDLALYFQTRGIKAVVCSLNREQVLLFFRRFANRPLLAQGIPGQGGFAALLGFVEGFLIAADPATGVRAVPPQDLFAGFSGFAVYFPQLEALSTVAKILACTERRLALLRQSG
jgi:hypothetical protein